MSLAYLWVVFFMGAAWAAPTTPSSGTQPNFEHDSQMHNGPPNVTATSENNRTESAAATTLGVELTSQFPEEAECQNSWQRFMVDFDVHYESEEETQKRRGIFCDNWKRIQEHNVQYEGGKVSFKKKINQWADLTLEEWKNKQRPNLAPEFSKPKPTTEATAVNQTRIKCEGAWTKFLSDFSRKYDNDAETERRRSIFCENWQRIQEHNLQYEAGIVSHKKGINQWSDLRFEEWRKSQESNFPPNMEEPGTYIARTEASEVDQNGIKCQAAWEKFLVDFTPKYENDAETEKRRSIFCDNWKRIQEHNLQYEAGIVSHKKGINQWSDLTFEEWRKAQESHFPPNMEAPGNKTKATEVQGYPNGSSYTFPANMEEPGTYVADTTLKPKIVSEEQPGKALSQTKEIKEPADRTHPGNKTKALPLSSFPPNNEAPATYLLVKKESAVENKRIQCQAAWEKFLTDFNRKYENEAETEKRRSIFCDNWQRIQEHNLQYEAGIVSHKKGINQWSDLTFEEWKKTQESHFPPNMEKPGTYVEEATMKPIEPRNKELENPAISEVIENRTEASVIELKGIKCQAAWEKFLADYSPIYKNNAETNIRQSIFCDNWQRIQEHNAQYEAGKVSHEESISEFSDMTSEELKSQSPNILPPNLRPSENKREAEIVQVGPQQVWFPPNMEEPGIYVKETTIKPKLVDEELTDEVPRIEEFKNKTEANSVEVGSQQVWFPANLEEAGTYLAKPPKKSESLSKELTDTVPSK